MIALVLWLHVTGGPVPLNNDVKVEEGRVRVHRGQQSCEVNLSDADRERLAAALRNIHPEGWKPKYLDPDCANCLLYSLQVGGRAVVWNDASASKVPADARAVSVVLQDLMSCQ